MSTPLATVQRNEPGTVIGPGSHIKGDMAFDNAATILGTFEGTMSSKTELRIGEGGVCRANLDAPVVVIEGDVEGDIVAREVLQLNARARVTGDIAAAAMVVVQGASFVGHCRVGPEAVGGPETGSITAGDAPASIAGGAQAGRSGAARNAAAVTANLEAALAGLESRLAGLGRSRTTAAPAGG
jgi:cytoskeletal protein CcmA (bactofilin family)